MGDRKKSRRSQRGSAAGPPRTEEPVLVSTVSPGELAGAAPEPVQEVPEPQPIVIHPPVHGAADGAPAPGALAGEPTTEAEPAPPTRRHGPVIEVRDVAPAPADGAPAATPPEQTTGQSRRAFSLDALRGLFLVAMTVGFTVRGDFFPLWMYHRQFPPPDFALVPAAGIAWRDLTYVAFLFTMAAALPLTLSRRVERGETEIAIVLASVRRYLLLLVFALLIGHSNTYFIGYTQTARGIAVAGFVVMALLFVRPRTDWNPGLWRGLRAAAWVLAVAFLAASPLLYGEWFSVERIDEVIAGLAFASLAGSIVWYFTREHLVARLGILAGVVALYLGARGEGWLQQWWWSSPAAWAFAPSKLSLLTIVVPGTIAGDLILRWTRARDAIAVPVARWSGARQAVLALLTTAFAPVVTAGLYAREVLLTTQLVIGMVIVGMFLTARPAGSLERLLQALFRWGAVWLVLGLWMEPFEGGIRKVPETLSYFFTVTGVSMMLLVALTVLVDALGRRRWVSALIDVGHNPMLCYVLYTVLLNSVLELIPPLRGVLRGSAGEVALRMTLEVVAVVLIVRFFARRRIYWRT